MCSCAAKFGTRGWSKRMHISSLHMQAKASFTTFFFFYLGARKMTLFLRSSFIRTLWHVIRINPDKVFAPKPIDKFKCNAQRRPARTEGSQSLRN